MRSVTLKAFEDREHGTMGLIIDGMNDDRANACTEGLLIAHDVIEHVNGPRAIGDIADELQALGAIWMCRGQHGDLRRDGVGSMHSIEANIASDVTRMARDVAFGQYCERAPTTRAHDHDSAFEYILEIAKLEAREEIGEDADDEEALESYWQQVVPFMRIGARKLMRVWPGRFDANTVFWNIAEACDRACKHVEGYERYHLRYDRSGAWLDEAFDDGY